MINILQILIVIAHVFRAESLCYERSKNVFCTNEKPLNVHQWLSNSTDLFEWKFSDIKKIESKIFGHSNTHFSDLKQLHLAYNDISVIECRGFSAFPNLEVLNLAANHISELKKCQFDSLRNVKKLDLSINELEKFDIELQLLMPFLQQLNLSYNGLQSLIKHSLTGLDALQSLDLSHNELTSLTASFPSLVALQTLNISHNLGTIRIPMDFFQSIPNLRYFSYENTQFIFDTSRNPQQRPFRFLMHLDTNNIIVKQFIGHVDFLNDDLIGSEFEEHKNMDFSNLGIEKIHFYKRMHFDKLQTLNVSHNRIVRLNLETVRDFSHADTIDLSSNRIVSIDRHVLNTLTHLRQLFLANNFIEDIETSVWQHLDLLEVLDLANNRIATIPVQFMLAMPSLRTLDLQYNRIQHLSFQILHLETRLELLNVQGNPIETFSDPNLVVLLDTIVIDRATTERAIVSFKELSMHFKLFNTNYRIVEDSDRYNADQVARTSNATNSDYKMPTLTAIDQQKTATNGNRNRFSFRLVLATMYLACLLIPIAAVALRPSRRLRRKSQTELFFEKKVPYLQPQPQLNNNLDVSVLSKQLEKQLWQNASAVTMTAEGKKIDA